MNVSRLHVILPKHSNTTVCCVDIKIIGNIRFISIGKQYQWNCPIISLISSNSLLIRWHSSQVINIEKSIPHSSNIARDNRTVFITECDWKIAIFEIKTFDLISIANSWSHSTNSIWMIASTAHIIDKYMVEQIIMNGCEKSEKLTTNLKMEHLSFESTRKFSK